MAINLSVDFKKSFMKGIESFLKSKPVHELFVTEVCMEGNPRPENATEFWVHPDMHIKWEGGLKLFRCHCPVCGLNSIIVVEMLELHHNEHMHFYKEVPQAVLDQVADQVTRVTSGTIEITKD